MVSTPNFSTVPADLEQKLAAAARLARDQRAGAGVERRGRSQTRDGGNASRRSLVADPAFRRQIEAVHRLGPRVTGELIAELARRHGPDVEVSLSRFSTLDRDTLAALDALLWPPLPLHVVGGRNDN